MSGATHSLYATVIVPTFDRASTLDLSIKSVQAQTVPNIEILIAGDGVTPEVRDLALGLAGSDSRIVFHDWPKAPGRGGDNRDRAVQAARAERIFYNDDDDLFLTHHVESLGPVLDTHDAADDATGSISLSGRIQVSIANHSRGPMREALAAGSAKVVFDTHFAHRKSTYEKLGKPWLAEPVAWNLFQAFAADSMVKWRTIPGVTALSFHGAARRDLSPQERRSELDSWSPRLLKSLAVNLQQAAHYDWHLFVLANALRFLELGSFLSTCHVSLNGMGQEGAADVAVSISDDRKEALCNVFALLRREQVHAEAAAELAVRLADPILGMRPRYGQVAACLKAALGSTAAIKALRQHEVTDRHSRELRDCLLCLLLLQHRRLGEAEVLLTAILSTPCYYKGDALLLAAELARRQENAGVALEYATAAVSCDAKLRGAHNIAIWALVTLGKLDAAQAALADARTIFPGFPFPAIPASKRIPKRKLGPIRSEPGADA